VKDYDPKIMRLAVEAKDKLDGGMLFNTYLDTSDPVHLLALISVMEQQQESTALLAKRFKGILEARHEPI